jgi:hypothetical protein
VAPLAVVFSPFELMPHTLGHMKVDKCNAALALRDDNDDGLTSDAGVMDALPGGALGLP